MKIEISTDKSKLDIDYINSFLSKTYWAENRTIETMKTLIDNSLNFGVYLNNNQIGYARIVTDYAQFAYLMDVFISVEHQKKGYSKELIKFIMELEELKDVKVWRLATSDAHFLYEKFGFQSLKKPENLMELIKKMN
jgi:N-acetylglutamate synthase-like GNAT family acetyltransferase